MKYFRLSFIPLFVFLTSCATKPLVQEGLHRKDVIEVKLTPVIKGPLESINSFKLHLDYTLNNGQKRQIPQNIQTVEWASTETWDDFIITVHNATFKNGIITYNRRNISAERNQIFVKIKSKKSGASDSISVFIPYH